MQPIEPEQKEFLHLAISIEVADAAACYETKRLPNRSKECLKNGDDNTPFLVDEVALRNNRAKVLRAPCVGFAWDVWEVG